MTSPARRAAYEAALAIGTGRRHLGAALALVRDGLADSRDRALATDIVVGTERWRARLDFFIEQISRRPVGGLDAEVAAILRISTYQLAFLSRVPPSAVVNDAVDLTRRARKRSAMGLVNAVLRKLSQGLPPPPSWPEGPEGSAEWISQALAHLAVTESHPRWLVERWARRWGFADTRRWVAFNNTTPPVTLWQAPAERGTRLPDDWPLGVPTTYVPGGWLPAEGHLATPLLARGVAFAQDEASAAVGAVAAALASPPVLDACAAPGGKSLALAAALDPSSLLVAGDVRAARIATLRAALGRMAGRAVPLVRADASALPFAASLHTVLLDAPCSGLGTLRRDPDIKWRAAEGDLRRFAEAQHAMLVSAMRATRPGGHVIYATCSSEPEENEDLIVALQRNSAWTALDLRQCTLPGRVGELIGTEGWLRTTPPAHGLESFFAAVLTRPSNG